MDFVYNILKDSVAMSNDDIAINVAPDFNAIDRNGSIVALPSDG